MGSEDPTPGTALYPAEEDEKGQKDGRILIYMVRRAYRPKRQRRMWALPVPGSPKVTVGHKIRTDGCCWKCLCA